MSPGRMVPTGKSRTTGWTSAEYDRPVSLRRRRSWMPARKSCWSRIMGERDVRPIWSSTSGSMEASVLSTISISTGSTSVTIPPPSPAGPSLGLPLAPDHQGPEPVHHHPDTWRHGQRRPVLLHHRGAGHLVARAQVGTPHHGRVVPGAGEEHRAAPGGDDRAGAGPGGRQRRGVQRADPGEAHVHPLDAVLGPVPVAVAVEPLVLVRDAG